MFFLLQQKISNSKYNQEYQIEVTFLEQKAYSTSTSIAQQQKKLPSWLRGKPKPQSIIDVTNFHK